MNDYRAKFNNTKHFEKAIDVAYDSDKEYIRFLKQQLEVKDKVIEDVEDWRANLRCSYHNNQCMKLAKSIDQYDKYKEKIK